MSKNVIWGSVVLHDALPNSPDSFISFRYKRRAPTPSKGFSKRRYFSLDGRKSLPSSQPKSRYNHVREQLI